MDSNWSFDLIPPVLKMRRDRGEEGLEDHLEEIWEALEQQFGCDRYDDDPAQRKNPRSFPAVPSDNSAVWFELRWPDGLAPPPPESISPSFAAELEEVGPSL